jgi:hypothetical protein
MVTIIVIIIIITIIIMTIIIVIIVIAQPHLGLQLPASRVRQQEPACLF